MNADADETYIFCFRVADLHEVDTPSVMLPCEFGDGCNALLWVAESSILIKHEEPEAKLACAAHAPAVVAAAKRSGEYINHLAIHPVQAQAHQDLLRFLGGMTKEEWNARRGDRG